MQRDVLYPQSSLIAFIALRSPQMLNLCSQAYWQQAGRQPGWLASRNREGGRGRGDTFWQNRESQCPYHLSPLTGFPMHEFKADKTMAGFVLLIWRPLHRDQCCGFSECTVCTDVFGYQPIESARTSQEDLKLEDILVYVEEVNVSFLARFSHIWMFTYSRHEKYQGLPWTNKFVYIWCVKRDGILIHLHILMDSYLWFDVPEKIYTCVIVEVSFLPAGAACNGALILHCWSISQRNDLEKL